MALLQRVRAGVGFTTCVFLMTLVAGLAAPTAGSAAVTYSFQWSEEPGPGDRSSAFTLGVPRFVLGKLKVGVDQLQSCSTLQEGGACGGVGLYTNASNFTFEPWNAIEFRVNFGPEGAGSSYFYFADGAFRTPGVYQDQRDGVDAQLAVSGFADAVPEPSTWLLLIAGFGGAGAMLRRHRLATAHERNRASGLRHEPTLGLGRELDV
jgi:hypothetical protein